MNIEGTIKIISDTAEGVWTSGNVIAILVALISIIGSVVVSVISNRNAKKISESNNDMQNKINEKNITLQEKWNNDTLQFQEKINKANIDANLIAAARIDWIQNVRKITAEIITLVNKCLTPIEKDNLLDVTLQAKEKIELLILYFGNENINQSENVCLDKTTDNKGKNKEIVNFLSSLSKKLTINFEIVKDEKLENLKILQEKRLSEIEKHTLGFDYCYFDEISYTMTEPVLDKEYEKELNQIQDKISKIEEHSISLEKDTIRLREIIRLYLKIEWAQAKTGS